ncbi:hypothetical protein ABI59_01970 [Acidobacteria bacterium Mor1]|nr:hypothetical protein ABI59_01970 [Acidobacteria bacterium Mor1]
MSRKTLLRQASRGLLGLLCLAALALPASAQMGVADLGAARLLHIDRLVVVYPAGPGQNAALNRWSAERRAAFLAESRNIEVEVVADDAVTPAHRARHMLVLGWNNRVFNEKVPAPFKWDGRALQFLGQTHTGQQLDLLLSHNSPYHPERVLFFWSRIDPPIDRFMTMPIRGSDWVVLDRYLAVRQGMFARQPTWPPQRDETAEKDHTSDLKVYRDARRTLRGKHYTMTYPGEGMTPERAKQILAQRDAAVLDAAKQLGMSAEGYRFRLHVYKDVDEKLRLTGVTDRAHSYPRTGELFVVDEYAAARSFREEIHLLTQGTLGESASSAVYEGFAVHHQGRFAGMELDLLVGTLLDAGELPKVDQLLDEEIFRRIQPQAGFGTAALLVRWMLERKGIDGLKAIYRPGPLTAADIARAAGVPAADLDGELTRFARKFAGGRQGEVDYMAAMKRASEAHLISDYAGIAQAMRDALEAKPGDPQALFNLASANTRLREFALSERILTQLLEQGLDPQESHFPVFAVFDLGRLADIQGKREEAVAQYRKVLTMKDHFDAHNLAREAIDVPWTLERMQ